MQGSMMGSQQLEYQDYQPDAHYDEEAKNQKRTSKYRGVCWNKKNRRWQASINVGGRYHYLGSFMSEDQAAKAFDKAAYEIRGKRAKLNFPESQEIYEMGINGDGLKEDEDGNGMDGGLAAMPSKRRPDAAKAPPKPKRQAKPAAKPAESDSPAPSWGGLGGDSMGQVMQTNYNQYLEPSSALDFGLGGAGPNGSTPLNDLLAGGSGLTPQGANLSPHWGGALSPTGLQSGSAKEPDSGGPGPPEMVPCDMPHLGVLFNGFGTSSAVLKLLPQAYHEHKLLGAVIENCRNTNHFGAAVWDGKRMHTLEGFQCVVAAEETAVDLINMLSAMNDDRSDRRILYEYAVDASRGRGGDPADDAMAGSGQGRGRPAPVGRPRKTPGRKRKVVELGQAGAPADGQALSHSPPASINECPPDSDNSEVFAQGSQQLEGDSSLLGPAKNHDGSPPRKRKPPRGLQAYDLEEEEEQSDHVRASDPGAV